MEVLVERMLLSRNLFMESINIRRAGCRLLEKIPRMFFVFFFYLWMIFLHMVPFYKMMIHLVIGDGTFS